MTLYYFIINSLNFLLPKFSKRIAIISYPDFDDQCRAIIDSNRSHQIIVLSSSEDRLPEYFTGNAKVVKRNSLRGIFYLTTSGTLLLTHGLNYRFKLLHKSRQLVLNLTHGMYFKKMHLLLDNSPPPKFHYILCCSLMHKGVLSAMFGISEDKVIVKGLPRNKYLLSDTNNKWLKNLKLEYNKVHVWLPTYRKSHGNYSRVDSDSNDLFGSDAFDISKLNSILHLRNEYLIVKPHPMAEFSQDLSSFSHVKILQNEDLAGLGCSLYELLSISDSLWTDYSSVFIDYMVTGRPIIFTLFDYEYYRSNRGFVFDLESLKLPGEIIYNCDELYSCVEVGSYNLNYDLNPYLDEAVYRTLLDDLENLAS